MFRKLYELYLTKEAACIYANYNDTGKFHFGKIVAVNESEVAIQTVTPDGEMDGIVVIGIDCINRVETNSQYVEKMKKLCYEESFLLSKLQIGNKHIAKNVLLQAFKDNYAVSIELMNSGQNDVVGIVKCIDDTVCSVEQYDEYGFIDGEAYFLLRDITKIAVLSQDEKIIMRLIERNQAKKTGDGLRKP